MKARDVIDMLEYYIHLTSEEVEVTIQEPDFETIELNKITLRRFSDKSPEIVLNDLGEE